MKYQLIKQKRLQKLHKKIKSLEKGLSSTQSRMDQVGSTVLYCELELEARDITLPPHHEKNTPTLKNPMAFTMTIVDAEKSREIKGNMTQCISTYHDHS